MACVTFAWGRIRKTLLAQTTTFVNYSPTIVAGGLLTRAGKVVPYFTVYTLVS